MTTTQLTLILMEGLKCGIAIWLGMLLWKISIILNSQIEYKQPKGRLLKYIIGHNQWLIGLTVGLMLLLILAYFGIKELNEFESNWKKIWIDKGITEIEVKRLGDLHAGK